MGTRNPSTTNFSLKVKQAIGSAILARNSRSVSKHLKTQTFSSLCLKKVLVQKTVHSGSCSLVKNPVSLTYSKKTDKLLKYPVNCILQLYLSRTQPKLLEKLQGKLERVAEMLNARLTENSTQYTHEKLFEDVIEHNSIYRTILKQIKQVYDQQLNSSTDKNFVLQNIKLKSENAKLSLEVNKEGAKTSIFRQTTDKLRRENNKLDSLIEKREQELASIEEYYSEVMSIPLKNLSKTQTLWKIIIEENRNYSKLIKDLKTTQKSLKHNEKKLLKSISTVKQQGMNLHEIYKTDVLSKLRNHSPENIQTDNN